MTTKEITRYVKLGEKHDIPREEVYHPNAPAHWPHDRCMMTEGDVTYAKRIAAMSVAQLTGSRRKRSCS